jgi:hypothetical protein
VLDSLISAALAVPVLIVALAVIAIIGIESGILAFIVGLSLTGWGETARMVREQTRGIKGQLYVEAARALGQPELQIILRHVLRQLMPLLWVLFAFEISGTLLSTATLGFLGYYLGGGVWFQVEDFFMQRITGEPELGQMLAIAAETPERPEAMLFAGTFVFLTVMGFNLLGEGLRSRLNHARPDSPLHWILDWLEARLVRPAFDWASARPEVTRGLAGGALFVLLGLGLLWWVQNNGLPAPESGSALAVAGANLWASERRDPQGSMTIDAAGPASPSVLWQFESADGFSGGPVVAADGTVYVSGPGNLYAVDPGGQLLWKSPLRADPVGAPALGRTGTIYVVGRDGSLAAFDSQGALAWQAPPLRNAEGIAGPIVGANESIYYPVEGYIRAVSPDGRDLWWVDIPYSYISPLPRLDPTGARLAFEDLLFSTQDGSPLSEATFNPLDRYLVGADGRMYLQEETAVHEWRPEGEPAPPAVTWNLAGFAFGFPADSGVTSDGFVWMNFTSGFQDARIVWADLKGNVLGQVIFPQRPTRVIGVDGESNIYLCGANRQRGAECVAYQRGTEEPAWSLALGARSGQPVGGALLPGRLYVTTAAGLLFALGDGVSGSPR